MDKKNRSFRGLADISGKVYGSAGNYRPFGSIDKCDLAVKLDTATDKNYGRDGGTLVDKSRPDEIALTLSFQSLSLENLALATRGTLRSEAAGTVTDFAITVSPGEFVELDGISQTDISLKNNAGTLTYEEGVHYKRGGSGIEILDGETPTKPKIASEAQLKISYSYAGIDVIEALTAPQTELVILFDGLNEAENNDNTKVKLYRWSPGIVKNLSLISDKFARCELEGKLILDPTRTGEGLSKFFSWITQKAA